MALTAHDRRSAPGPTLDSSMGKPYLTKHDLIGPNVVLSEVIGAYQLGIWRPIEDIEDIEDTDGTSRFFVESCC